MLVRICLAALLLLAGPAQAAAPAAGDPAEMEAFFDGLVPAALQQAGIAGAAISVVKDGRLVLAKGYGTSNLATGAPVVADQTLFRPGSVSKLFTWTAVMQLVEQGKLDLHADVNAYLDFKIPATFAQPITLQHLLTHTAGFEEMAVGVGFAEPDKLQPAGAFLAAHLPARRSAPGDRIGYSNYGAALAGYIVERVSGEPFASYVQRHVLQPLGMQHSTMAQPLPASLAPALTRSYDAQSRPKPLPFAYVQVAPAGSLSSTATDMARFMLAHLDGGAVGDGRILQPATVALMHATKIRTAPGQNGLAFGFLENNRNGWRILGHPGDIGGFHASLHLIPDAGLGLFIALNSTGEHGRQRGSDVVRNLVFSSFVDRYLPPREPADQAQPIDAARDSARVVGRYQSTRHNESLLDFLAPLTPLDQVTADANGTIALSTRLTPAGAVKRWQEIAPLTYREQGGKDLLIFLADADGKVWGFQSTDVPPALFYERVHGLRGAGLLAPLLFLSLAVCTAMAGFALLRRRRLLSRIAAGLQVLVLLGWGVFAVTGLDAAGEGGAAVPLFALRVAALLVVVAPLAVAADARHARGWIAWLRETSLLLSSLYLAWFALAYGLLRFGARF